MSSDALIMVAKKPVAGDCKTRLCPPLTHHEAAQLYGAFIQDLLSTLSTLAGPERTTAVAYTPPAARNYFETRTGERIGLVPQTGGDLGERLFNITAHYLGRGFRRVVIMSSDSPSLPPAWIEDAFAALSDADVVLGPCEDGGYYLVGLRQPTPELFQNIDWSTSEVLEQSLHQAAAAGRSVHLLPVWYDIDSIDEVNRLAGELLDAGARRCPATTRIVQAMADAGRIAPISPMPPPAAEVKPDGQAL